MIPTTDPRDAADSTDYSIAPFRAIMRTRGEGGFGQARNISRRELERKFGRPPIRDDGANIGVLEVRMWGGFPICLIGVTLSRQRAT